MLWVNGCALADLLGVLLNDDGGQVALVFVAAFQIVLNGKLGERHGFVELPAVNLPNQQVGRERVVGVGLSALQYAVQPVLVFGQGLGFVGDFVLHAGKVA